MVWGLGAYAKGRADREKENRAIRAENASLYNEYIRLNPDITADQADAYANQLSGGSEYFRGMLPSKSAMRERVKRRQTELANAAQTREIQNRNAKLNELEKAGNIFADIAIGSKDMETARKAFGDMGNGLFSEDIIGKDGVVNQAVVGLGTRLAKTQITPEVQQYISQWGSTANPSQMDSVLNRITNKDLRGPFQQQLLNMADNKKTMLINKIPNSAKLAADQASVTDISAQDVNWDKIKSEIAPWVTDPTELEQLREKYYDPSWKSWLNRRDGAINTDKNKAATAANTLIGNLNVEDLRNFKTVRELENFILNEVRKSVDPNLLTLNSVLDIDGKLDAEINRKFNEIKRTTLNQVNQQEEQNVKTAIANQRKKNTNELAVKDPDKFRKNLQAIVGTTFFGDDLNDKNSAKALQMAVQIQAETEEIAQAMMLDISSPNYYNLLVQTMTELSDFQITEAGIDRTSIRLAMMNMATRGNDPSEAARIIKATEIIAGAGSSENYTGGGLPEIVADDTLFQQFMIEYERLTEEAINNQFNIVPDDVSQLTPNVVENNLRGQASEIRQMLGGQGGLNDTIRDLRKAIAENKFVGEDQILEDANDDRIIIRDEIASIDRTITNYNQMLANPDLTNFTSEERLVIQDVLSDFSQLRSDLLKASDLINSELNNYRAMKFNAVSAKDPADKTANSADFLVAKLGELKTSGKTTTELSVEAEQLVNEMIATFDLNELLRSKPADQRSPAFNLFRDIVRNIPVATDVGDLVSGGGLRGGETELKIALLDIARNELGLPPVSGRDYLDTDKYSGLTLSNLVEELGQNVFRPVSDAVTGFFTAPQQ
tara:strand:+ start:9171 stop:11672 length:2502 start_codon:yes stop_codon:yes gene_type:complete